ncbi:hypothetical protein PLESTB_001250300 [Pleodorina starrii]|uniref:Uncharacterized protein n=1 Tax=Pleodorina starrii TaxID=330485 RepID=A0A9W6BSY2_9CHLO|nr:hypothetical protein PLESTM_000209600 [Pleodorina starrii]GLC57654.1 hypothetical protein PLESTB_001250300 [Pleodorina starrii]GLC63324.1 hypothetical protein PLESTF_000024100 [Pleodorina starrii]
MGVAFRGDGVSCAVDAWGAAASAMGVCHCRLEVIHDLTTVHRRFGEARGIPGLDLVASAVLACVLHISISMHDSAARKRMSHQWQAGNRLAPCCKRGLIKVITACRLLPLLLLWYARLP